jgi:hypothetical protein
MQADDMRKCLKEWGLATANRYCVTRADRSVHMLEQARDMAPGTTEKALRQLVGRDGTARRKQMAKVAEIPKMAVVPMWAAEPIRAANDADHPHERAEIAVDVGIPDGLMWVERAVAQLGRSYPLRAQVIRAEYTISASQAVKVRMVQEQFGGRLTLRQYRTELARALEWFVGRMAA